MAKKSSIAQLDPRIKEAADAAIREGRATIDDIVELLHGLGAQVSRSAVGRYKKSAEQQMRRFQEAQEIAKVWISKLEADPAGDVGRLLSELLKTAAFQALAQMGDEEAAAGAEDLMLLSTTLRNVGLFDKGLVEKVSRIRKEELDKAANRVEEAARAQGMTEDQARFWREKVLGVTG